MTVRAVVFDIGGVLETMHSTPDPTTVVPGLDLTWEQLMERTGEVWAKGSIGAVTESEARERFRELLGLDEAALDTLMEAFWAGYLGEPNTALMDYLRGLRPRYLTGIISNSFVGAREREEQQYGYSTMVDVIVYSHEVGLSKPDPRIYQLACQQLGVQPSEMVYTDDVEACVDGARELGINAVLFRDTAQAIAEIEGYLAG
ncbi:MAG: HAD family phosphatase [Micromonosporaceae bacterium]|nr:HAD family phosphatase [Micromonosporaceae bacterium]